MKGWCPRLRHQTVSVVAGYYPKGAVRGEFSIIVHRELNRVTSFKRHLAFFCDLRIRSDPMAGQKKKGCEPLVGPVSLLAP